MDEQQGGYGLGGGVQVLLRTYLDDISAGLSVTFLKCEFKRNQAFLGSGLAFVIFGKTSKTLTNIKLEVINSRFLDNGCEDRNGLGGGAYLILHVYPDEPIILYYNINIILTSVNFTSNCAEHGGGVYYYSSKQSLHSELSSHSVLFDRCIFKKYEAHIGSAIIVSPSTFFTVSKGLSVIPILQCCQFLENKVQDYNGT